MSQFCNIPIIAAALVGAAVSAMANATDVLNLQAPRLPRADEAIEVQVTTGPLPRGARLVLVTEQGMVLGAIFPFPAPQGTIGTVPIPADAMSGGIHLRLRLQVIEPGSPPRPPQPGEVDSVDLILVPGAK